LLEKTQDVISASVAQQRFTMLLLGCFGLISLLLGAAGLYGVMSYTVARRTKEIGVRLAIGADRGDILRMVLSEAGRLVALGLMIGLTASLAGAQLLRSLLFDVAPRNPLTMGAMCGVLLLTGLLPHGGRPSVPPPSSQSRHFAWNETKVSRPGAKGRTLE